MHIKRAVNNWASLLLYLIFVDHFLGVPGRKNRTNEVLLVEAVWNSENASVSENTVQMDTCKLLLDRSSSGDSGSHFFKILLASLLVSVKPGKPWTPESFLECYCVARKKPIRREKTKLQARTLISLWFCGLLACPNLCCDWSQHNEHSCNISSVHGFPGRTVISKNDISNRVRGREAWEDAIKGLRKLHHWFVIIRLHLIVWIGSKTVCCSKHGYIIVNSI